MKQQARQIVRSTEQAALNRKLITTKTVVTNSEVKSSSNLNFITNHMDTLNNIKIIEKIHPNIHSSVFNSFASIIKQIQVKHIKDSFYKLIAFKNEQKSKINVAILITSIIKSKITLHKTFVFTKLKNTIFGKNHHKNFLNVLSIIYKRKYRQNLTYSVKKLKQHSAAAKIQDLSQMKNKIKMSLSKNSQSKKSLQSIVQIVFPQSPKNGNLSPRDIQKQIQFNKFLQSLQQNRAQKNYTQLKINIGNLSRRFGKQQKYAQKVNDYNNINELINQIQKYQLISKQSNYFIQKLSTIDLDDIQSSILSTKGIRKQISTTKARFLKKQQQNQETIKILSNLQKINQNFNLSLEAKIAKNSQKNKVQIQLQQKIAAMMKNQAELKKSMNNYEENQKYLKGLLQKSINFEEFLKELDQSRKHKKRGQIPHTLLIKISDYFANHKKHLTQLNMILKTQASLYQRKNLSQENFNTELQKLSEKYQQNQFFTSIQQNLNFLIFNVQQKEKFVLQTQMKKLKFENQRLNKYNEGQKLKINLLTDELNKVKNSKKLYETTSQKNQPQHTNLQFEQLSANLKTSKQNIVKLQNQLKQWKKSILDHELADEILIRVIQKIEKNQQTWMKDVQSLKKGKNDKYQVVIKVVEYIQKISEQNQRIKAHNVSQMQSNLLDQSFLVNRDLQQMNSIIRRVLSNNAQLSFVSNITNPNLANLVILLQAYKYNMELVKNFTKERELLENKIFQKEQNNQNQQHILRFISKCQQQIPKRDYLLSDQCWNSRLSSYEHPNAVHPQIIKLLKKLSKQFRNILNQNRQSQIKQHQNYKQEINNLSDSLKLLQIDMKQKQLRYQQELSMYQRNQEISARKSLQSVGSKKSIKSVQSSTSQNRRSLNQQNQKYKQMLGQYAKDQKLMLQKINNLTDEVQKCKFDVRKYENSLKQARLKSNQLQIQLTQKTRQLSVIKQNNSLQNTSLKQKLKMLQKIISASPSSQDKQQLIYLKQAYAILLKKYQQKSGYDNISQSEQEMKAIHNLIQERVKKSYQQTYQKLKKQIDSLQIQKQHILTKYHQDVVLIQKQLSQETHNLKIQLEQYRAQTIQRAEYQLLLGQIQKRDQLIQELNKQILFLNKKLDNIQYQFKLNQRYNTSIDTSQDMERNINQSVENSQNIRHITENTYVVTHSSSGSNLNSREISELQQLRMRLRQVEEQKVAEIQHEVIKALQHQEMEFNQFLAKNNQERELYYQTVIIPERIKLFQHEYLQTNPTVIQHVSHTITLHENQIQLIVNQKYQEWKHTYLVAYLQEAKKKWLQQFKQNQLQLIINQKMSEWQSVRLFSIVKEKRNEWIVKKLVQQRETQWKRQKQLEITTKIRQMQNHWETFILPERIKQWQTTHQTIVTHTQNTFTQVQLQKILAQEHLRWQHTFQQELQNKILQVEKFWEFHILPQRKKQWEITASQTHSTSSQLSINVEQIINAKYEEWKQTYLVQYLKLAKLKWLQEFKTTQLQLIIQQKYAQWQGVRLLSIIRDAKHSWIFQSILKEKRFEWQKQKEKEWTLKLRQVEVYYQHTLLPQKEKQWKLHYQQEIQTLLKKQAKPSVDIQGQIRKRQVQWQRLKELQIQAKIIQVEQYWQNVILPDNRRQWQSEFISVYQRQHPVQIQVQNIDYEALINQKYEEWKHTYLVQYLKLQKLKWLEQFKSRELQEILKAKFAEWESVRLWSIVTEQRNKWIIDKLLNQYRIQWEKTKEHEWSLRVVQIEQFWQNQLARNRREWELTSGNRVNEVIHQEQRKIQLIVNQRIDEWRNTYLTNILNEKHQEWHLHFINVQLQKILNQKHQEWHSHFIRVELPKILNQKQAQWSRHKEEQYSIRLSRAINQQRLRIESIQSQQLSTVSNEADKNQILRLKRIIQGKSQEINEFEKQFKNWQKLKLENVTLKENIYRLENDNLRQLNQLKLKYQANISEINHERSMLSMQIKELQLNLSKKSKDHQSPNLVSLEKQIITLEATCKSKDSEILFLKRSLDTSSHQNHQMQTKITSLNSKIHTFEGQLQQARNQAIKFEYELKYWKEKEQSMNKKIQSKQNQLNEMKNRFQFEKGQLQKRIRELSMNSQNQSTFQIKISELQSQISIKNNNIKSLQNELQRRKRDIQEEKLKYQNLSKQIQIYKNSLRQYEGIIQQHKLQARKYYEEVQRLKSFIQSFQSKEKSYNQQIRRLQSKPTQSNQLQDFIRQNERLRVQIFRMKQKILYMENQQSRQITNLKETISVFEHRLKYQSVQKQDYTQIQVLRRINGQISQLVSANKQLQLRIIVLQNQKNLTSFGLNISRFFESFQEQLDNLINYLVSNEIFKPDANTVYNKFTLRSREALSHGYIQDYFRQWQSFMRNLLQENSENLVKQLKDQRQQISDLKRVTTNIKVSDDNLADDSQQIIQKYDMILNDAKFLLKQYIESNDREYVKLMATSLGIDEVQLKE